MASYNGSSSSGKQPPQESRRSQNERDQPNRGSRNRIPDDDFDREAFNFYVSDVHSNISLRTVLHSNLYEKFNRIIHLLKEINHGDHLWMGAIQFTRNNLNSESFEQRSLYRNEEQRRRYNLEMIRIQHELYVILQKLDVVYRKIYVASKMIHLRRFDAETEKRMENEYERKKPFVFTNGNVLQLVEPFFEMIKKNAIADNKELELPEPLLVENEDLHVERNRHETERERSVNPKKIKEDSDQMKDIMEICDKYRMLTQNRPQELRSQTYSSQRSMDEEMVSNWKVTSPLEFQQPAPEVVPSTYQSSVMNVPTIRLLPASPARSTDEMDHREADNQEEESQEDALMDKIGLASQDTLRTLSTLTGEVPDLETLRQSPREVVDIEALLREAEDEQILHQALMEKLDKAMIPIPVTKIGSSSEEVIFQMDDIETESTPETQPKPKEAAQAVQPEEAAQAVLPEEAAQVVQPEEAPRAVQPEEAAQAVQPEEAAQAVQPIGDLIKQRLAQFEGQSDGVPKCKFVPRKSVDNVPESAKPPKDASKESALPSPEEDIKKAPEDAVETEGGNLVIDETKEEREAEETSGDHVVPQIETRSNEGEQKENKPPSKEPKDTNAGANMDPVVENKNQETQTASTISPREILSRPECPVGKQLLVREAEEALSQQDADATNVPPKARPVGTRERPTIVQPVPRQPPPTPEDRNPYAHSTINIYGADYTGERVVSQAKIPEEDKPTTSDGQKKDAKESSEVIPDSKKIPEAIADKSKEVVDVNKKTEEGIKKVGVSKEEDKVVGKEGDTPAGNVGEAAIKPDIIKTVSEEKKQVEMPTSPKQDKPPGVLKGNTPEKKEPEREETGKKGLEKPKSGKENVKKEKKKYSGDFKPDVKPKSPEKPPMAKTKKF